MLFSALPHPQKLYCVIRVQRRHSAMMRLCPSQSPSPVLMRNAYRREHAHARGMFKSVPNVNAIEEKEKEYAQLDSVTGEFRQTLACYTGTDDGADEVATCSETRLMRRRRVREVLRTADTDPHLAKRAERTCAVTTRFLQHVS